MISVHSKILSIPRILPKMTLSLEDCIALFKSDKKTPVNK